MMRIHSTWQAQAKSATSHGSHTGTTWSQGRTPPESTREIPASLCRQPLGMPWLNIEISQRTAVKYASCQAPVQINWNVSPTKTAHAANIPLLGSVRPSTDKPLNQPRKGTRPPAFPVLSADVEELRGQAGKARRQPKPRLHPLPKERTTTHSAVGEGDMVVGSSFLGKELGTPCCRFPNQRIPSQNPASAAFSCKGPA